MAAMLAGDRNVWRVVGTLGFSLGRRTPASISASREDCRCLTIEHRYRAFPRFLMKKRTAVGAAAKHASSSPQYCIWSFHRAFWSIGSAPATAGT